MRSITDISSTLGQYMLKGWVLTDTPCHEPGCNIPLMRSPNGTIPVVNLCVNCNGAPSSSMVEPQSPLSRSSSSHTSRSSTPPTEVSSATSSPVFATPVETEASLRRRQQSDAASAEIGKRLLKGWAMLADECPNLGCYGVPLVRPPKAGGEKDPRKECVVCGSVYIGEKDSSGWERLISLENDTSQSTPGNLTTSVLPSASGDRGKENFQDETFQTTKPVLSVATLSRPVATKGILSMSLNAESPSEAVKHTEPTTVTLPALEVSARSLELTLHTLSQRLTVLCSGQAMVDPGSIGLVADAIYRVARALEKVKQMQWSQGQRSYS